MLLSQVIFFVLVLYKIAFLSHLFNIPVIESGELWTMGLGKFGQLGGGVNSLTFQSIPIRASALDQVRIVSVACGWKHTLCLSG